MNRITHEQYLEAIKIIRAYQDQLKVDLDIIKEEVSSIIPMPHVTPDTTLENSGVSVRLFNILIRTEPAEKYRDTWDRKNVTIKELSAIGKMELIGLRNVGSKTLEEFANLLKSAGYEMKP